LPQPPSLTPLPFSLCPTTSLPAVLNISNICSIFVSTKRR
jgi:hypothetical protein